MKTLVIYDNNGIIFKAESGDYLKPSGLQHLEIEIPNGKRVSHVDISNEVHEAVFVDLPPSEIELMKEQLRLEMAESNAELFEMMLAMQMQQMEVE